ncbi:lysophospholipid acyltransferase family protein [Alkaliphilus peptidifermentans]|uniref:1-acyl-sn-glycerol-3-phosphate acyltransferase n=1 Tax=Alkaliphilus peptidifermentans DSM 18978 TaxID=1120976 RepID=A0A1G5CH14_9FIRM|nr:lysophospholipid acyltransferase family protein [Alkaliphilus peptidifermentans]SCY01604.1 1-acyl-sn-glycerol-3-phosphate acyltransferase [Alkaliphilus peptidifermentans DSM 18978]
MRTILWFIYFWIYTLGTAFSIPRVKYFIKKDEIQKKRDFTQNLAHNWAKKLVLLTGSNVEVLGLENIPDGPVLFVSNHQGNFDIPILLSSLPKSISFVAKIELKKLPIINRWMEFLECVFIDRKDLRQSLRAITKAIEVLKSGQSMVIFPEGTRSKGSQLQPFKPGSLKMATKANVPIIPVTIKGSYKIMEANNNKITPAKVQVIISEPIYVDNIEKSTDLTVLTYKIIKNNLDFDYEKIQLATS